jgi:hypothetical protein
MNTFELRGIYPQPDFRLELRLERYHRMGYDVEVARRADVSNPLQENVIITLELKNEGFKNEITFFSQADADKWNRGHDVEVKDSKITRTTLAFIVEPIVNKPTGPKPSEEARNFTPKRVIEI